MSTDTVPEAEPKAGFGYLPCPSCREDAVFFVFLDEGDMVKCNDCDEEFTLAEVKEKVERFRVWDTVISWLSTIPRLRK